MPFYEAGAYEWWNMLFFASLLGIASIGAAAFSGLDAASRGDDADVDIPENEATAEPSAATDGLARLLGDGDTVAGPSLQTDLTNSPPPDDGVILSGTDTAEVIMGTPGPDQINGGGADDRISGAEGADILLGGDGADEIAGQNGADSMHGGAGDDTGFGQSGDDQLFGHGGDDALSGGADDDSLVGGAGEDQLDGGTGDDALHGGLDDDRLSGGAGADSLFGGWGNDTVSGLSETAQGTGAEPGSEADFLNGGGDDDMILAGQSDIASGGSGADTIMFGDWIASGQEVDILDFEPNEDQLIVFFDDAATPDPTLTIEPDPDNEDDRHVLLNGAHIATVLNAPGLTLDHIALMPEEALSAMITP